MHEDHTHAHHHDGHGTPGDHGGPPVNSREYWEDRYAGTDRVWSGHPNAVLAAEAADLLPGTALDVGSGEGGDAVWLAGRGWQVTATDIAQGALDRVRAHADSVGVGHRVRTLRADVAGEGLGEQRYDLVTSAFLHPAPGSRDLVLSRLAAAVAPGGTLLMISHHPHDMPFRRGLGADEDWFFTADQVAATLDPALWRVEVAEARSRTEQHPGAGEQHEVHDAVLRARRSV